MQDTESKVLPRYSFKDVIGAVDPRHLPLELKDDAGLKVYKQWSAKTKELPPLCVYHGNCLDGFTAAWAMWLKYPDTEFVAGVYGQDPPKCDGRDVYLLDFSYKRDVLLSILEVAKSVTILDHHKSAELDLQDLPDIDCYGGAAVIFDMQKSGARLAWEWFHPDKIAPRLIAYVEDRDLWRFALLFTREISAALFSYDYSFETWSVLSGKMQQVGLDSFVTEGAAIERKHHKDIKELLAKTRRLLRIDGTLVPTANLPYTLASDAANLLAVDAPFGATYYVDSDGWHQFSLRSREGGADVSVIALRYGGGGHKHAAGFRVKSLEAL